MIKYGYTILYVEQVEQTLAFYERAFGFSRKFITPEKDYGELETGATTLAFAAYSIAEYNGIAIAKTDLNSVLPNSEIAFVTEEIDQVYNQAIVAGAVSVKPPTSKPWGQIVAYVRDLNGFLVELCTPVKIN